MIGIGLGLPYIGTNGGNPLAAYPLATLASAVFDFANQRFYTGASGSPGVMTQKTFSSLFTFTGSNAGTYINNAGLITQASTNTPRFTYDPVTLQPQGILIEEQRTNLLLNSTINGANLATQSVTVAATAYALTFYGTGTITLSGTSVAGPLVGSGAYPTRSILLFTPTAGTLTLTSTGTVQYALLEAGAYPTTFIPTAGATVTRTADSCYMTGVQTAGYFNNIASTMLSVATSNGVGTATSQAFIAAFNDNSGGNNFFANNYQANATTIRNVATGPTGTVDINVSSTVTANVQNKSALAGQSGDWAASVNGAAVQTGAGTSMPVPTQLVIGGSTQSGASSLDGTCRLVIYYPSRLSNAQLQAIST